MDYGISKDEYGDKEMNYSAEEPRVAVIIEDEDDIRDLLEVILVQAGFHTIATKSGIEGIMAVKEHSPLITTLDVSMPGMDGFEVAKRIRSFSSSYIFMLTARDEEIDTIQGLEAGADDYITKPFRPRELRARIDAVLRRPVAMKLNNGFRELRGEEMPSETRVLERLDARGPSSTTSMTPAEMDAVASRSNVQKTEQIAAAPRAAARPAAAPAAAPKASVASVPSAPAVAVETGENWLTHNGLRLMPSMRLVEVDDVEVDLTRTEFDLLASLIESNRRVRSKADLALLLRGESYVTAYFVNESDKRAVETHISNLRRKLGDGLNTPRWIETVRGVGYRLAPAQ